jgi:hypothetical protein
LGSDDTSHLSHFREHSLYKVTLPGTVWFPPRSSRQMQMWAVSGPVSKDPNGHASHETDNRRSGHAEDQPVEFLPSPRYLRLCGWPPASA